MKKIIDSNSRDVILCKTAFSICYTLYLIIFLGSWPIFLEYLLLKHVFGSTQSFKVGQAFYYLCKADVT